MAVVYRKVYVRMYADDNFRKLSPPSPSGQWLWIYLLTGPYTTPVPGVVQAGEMALAESLGWPIKDFRRCFNELVDKNLVHADFKNRLIFIPKSIKYNLPESPNVVISWYTSWDLVPECELKEMAFATINEALVEMGDAYAFAWEANSVRHKNYKIKPETMTQVKARDKGMCRYCGRNVIWSDRRGELGGTYDHIDPAGPGTADNVVVACRSCNSKKGFRTPERAKLVLIHHSDLDQIGSRSDLDRTNAESVNQEQEQEQEQDKKVPPSRKVDEDPAPWLWRTWLFYLKRRRNSHDEVDQFEELTRLGFNAAAIESEIRNPNRDRTEPIWDFVKRIKGNPAAKFSPVPQHGQEDAARAAAEANRKQLEAVR